MTVRYRIISLFGNLNDITILTSLICYERLVRRHVCGTMVDMWFLICTLSIISFVQITKSECNLKNGKCVYDMKIGQQGKCDSFSLSSTAHVSGGTISGSCTCDDVSRVSTHMNAMKYTEGNLRQLMAELKQHLDNVTSELNSTDAKLQSEKQKSMQLHNTLKTKESLLNQTKDQLTNVLNSATAELNSLRGNLGNQTRALNMCQTAIGTKVTTQSGMHLHSIVFIN